MSQVASDVSTRREEFGREVVGLSFEDTVVGRDRLMVMKNDMSKFVRQRKPPTITRDMRVQEDHGRKEIVWFINAQPVEIRVVKIHGYHENAVRLNEFSEVTDWTWRDIPIETEGSRCPRSRVAAVLSVSQNDSCFLHLVGTQQDLNPESKQVYMGSDRLDVPHPHPSFLSEEGHRKLPELQVDL